MTQMAGRRGPGRAGHSELGERVQSAVYSPPERATDAAAGQGRAELGYQVQVHDGEIASTPRLAIRVFPPSGLPRVHLCPLGRFDG